MNDIIACDKWLASTRLQMQKNNTPYFSDHPGAKKLNWVSDDRKFWRLRRKWQLGTSSMTLSRESESGSDYSEAQTNIVSLSFGHECDEAKSRPRKGRA